ncbi:MAG: hypothetical protein P4L46_12790 [Fimbriimonas sp.]|nr:hypothetical protein [Fimbriimonas sp.]
MKSEISKPIVIVVVLVAVIAAIVFGMMYFRSSSGDISNMVIKPVPFSPPGGLKLKQPRGAPQAPSAPSGVSKT